MDLRYRQSMNQQHFFLIEKTVSISYYKHNIRSIYVWITYFKKNVIKIEWKWNFPAVLKIASELKRKSILKIIDTTWGMAHLSNIVVWKQIEQAIVQPKVRYADCISILILGHIQTILFAIFFSLKKIKWIWKRFRRYVTIKICKLFSCKCKPSLS